jgi:hypothetical protein
MRNQATNAPGKHYRRGALAPARTSSAKWSEQSGARAAMSTSSRPSGETHQGGLRAVRMQAVGFGRSMLLCL